jgi:cyclophilin family peptidyl-prolyl cis-trans isomerase
VQSDFGLLQCGGPENLGTGGPGYEYADEYPVNQYALTDPILKQPVLFPRGTLTMAPANGPNPNESQFNMMYKDSVGELNCTVFGTINQAGLATIDKVVKAGIAGSGDSGMPLSAVIINSVQIG